MDASGRADVPSMVPRPGATRRRSRSNRAYRARGSARQVAAGRAGAFSTLQGCEVVGRPMSFHKCDRLTGQTRRQPTATTREDEAMHEITPCLWFDTEGEEAARFYTSVFTNSRILDVARHGAAGPRPEGTVMTVSFELDGAQVRGPERRA